MTGDLVCFGPLEGSCERAAEMLAPAYKAEHWSWTGRGIPDKENILRLIMKLWEWSETALEHSAYPGKIVRLEPGHKVSSGGLAVERGVLWVAPTLAKH